MIPKECKRLAEVDFPIAVVSKHSAREKSIRHGHPSTLHLWWARRPLAACRAMLMALLLPDPCDEHCPGEFKTEARRLLLNFHGRPGGWEKIITDDIGLRKVLLTFIGDFANWDNSANQDYLETARGLVKAAHPEETPLVVDPFAGGGSIPLEALRLGCEAFASDLNPVACLILKVMLEDIPRHGPKLAEELRRVGAEIKEAAEKELAEFYPQDSSGAKSIAYLWARTVRCESPNCGAEIPLARSFWLCKKANRRRALHYQIVRPDGEAPGIKFEIFEPESEGDVPDGTVSRAKATCPCCNAVLPPDRVRAQLSAQRGGADVIFDDSQDGCPTKSRTGFQPVTQPVRIGGARLLAVVTLKEGQQGRHYRLPTERDYQAVWNAMQELKEVASKPLPNGLNPVPDEPLPPIGTLGFRVQRYGMLKWGDLFTARQKLALETLSSIVRTLPEVEISHKTNKILLSLSISRFADDFSSLCRWMDRETPAATFTRQALPILWDFCEIWPFDDASWSLSGSIDWVAKCADRNHTNTQGQVHLADACEIPLPEESTTIWFTDPPYYDAIPYADLSDFFYVWLKRMLPKNLLLCDPFDLGNPLTPKTREVVQDDIKLFNGRPKDRTFFETTLARVFSKGRKILIDDGLGCVVFAHKTTEGWEALLSGIIKGGWVITSSWPIVTERSGRPRAHESAALATSVHLICRPRPEDAPVGDWGEVLRELPKRVGDWMERLQSEGVRGADLVFACIGPALEIFSRYSRVETAEGREVGLPEYLEKVWEVVGRTALEQILGTAEAKARNSAAGALEEDARLTALFLWTLQSTDGESPSPHPSPSGRGSEGEGTDEGDEAPQGKTKGYSLIFDVVRRFAQPLGIHLPEWEGRIIETKKGTVRLLSTRERSKQLFGDKGASAIAEEFEQRSRGPVQFKLFTENLEAAVPQIKGRSRGKRKKAGSEGTEEEMKPTREATTLDRVHAAMLLQAGGQSNALRALIKAEQERGPDFLRLANSLSALYPKNSEEKRLLDAMLLAAPR